MWQRTCRQTRDGIYGRRTSYRQPAALSTCRVPSRPGPGPGPLHGYRVARRRAGDRRTPTSYIAARRHAAMLPASERIHLQCRRRREGRMRGQPTGPDRTGQRHATNCLSTPLVVVVVAPLGTNDIPERRTTQRCNAEYKSPDSDQQTARRPPDFIIQSTAVAAATDSLDNSTILHQS